MNVELRMLEGLGVYVTGWKRGLIALELAVLTRPGPRR